MVEQNGFKTKIKATTNLKESLDGADFVVVSIRAGGWANVMKDYELTTKLGYESSPDALGPTGIFADCGRSRPCWKSAMLWKKSV